MTPRERIAELETLLERVRKNAARRPARHTVLLTKPFGSVPPAEARSAPHHVAPAPLRSSVPAVPSRAEAPPAPAPLVVAPPAPPPPAPPPPIAAAPAPPPPVPAPPPPAAATPPAPMVASSAPPVASPWRSEPASAVQERPASVAPEELSEDDLVEVTTIPPAPDTEVVSSSQLLDDDQPPVSSSRSKVAATLDEAIASAAELESEHEVPVHTPPPESGPQEAAAPMPPGLEAPRVPDVDKLEADLLGPPSMGPTAEQLGETIELDAPAGPELEIDVTISDETPPEPERAPEELEVTLPRAQLPSGTYDVIVATPSAAAAAAAPATPPTPPLPSEASPERTARPVLGATDVAQVKLAEPAATRSFVELLDASLAL